MILLKTQIHEQIIQRWPKSWAKSKPMPRKKFVSDYVFIYVVNVLLRIDYVFVSFHGH